MVISVAVACRGADGGNWPGSGGDCLQSEWQATRLFLYLRCYRLIGLFCYWECNVLNQALLMLSIIPPNLTPTLQPDNICFRFSFHFSITVALHFVQMYVVVSSILHILMFSLTSLVSSDATFIAKLNLLCHASIVLIRYITPLETLVRLNTLYINTIFHLSSSTLACSKYWAICLYSSM